MNSKEIRDKFLNYFNKNNHQIVASSSLIPEGDTTLIFTNAGMFQFKNVFLGLDKRDYSRATSSQKCVRAGGKHNDLENVGYTARHHTFFEMLGNFSFGDYFKQDAIRYAWDFLTNELKIPKDRLYVTVFHDDDEAAKIWQEQESVPADRIFRFGEKDNFWRMGDTGPCGPCSEIFYDHFPEKGKVKTAEEFEQGGEEDRFVEIWNLVFMQFYEEPKGTLSPLPKPSVDTGMGLERLAALLQGHHNNYESDLFSEYIDFLKQEAGISSPDDKQLVAMRVMADHARCISFLVSDGVLPSNDGRGYVLRRIIRRAIRYGKQLSDQSLFSKLCSSVITKMGEAYPNLLQKKEVILHTVEGEEERFLKTLDQGIHLLEQELARLKKEKKNLLEGEIAFKLYDTYGFPLDLTQLMAKEESIEVDTAGFDKEMLAAKERARKTWKGATMDTDQAHLLSLAKTYGKTEFLGYESTSNESKILTLSDGKSEIQEAKEGDTVYLMAEATCFYAESGGQVGDSGTIEGDGVSALVLDCIKVEDSHLLQVKVEQGVLKKSASIKMTVYSSQRRQIAANHSATHLLHAALREVLGDHVTQAGSLVDSDRLRFDFTHNQSLTADELKNIEHLVNQEISMARDVSNATMSYDEAMDAGAMALFGEKYGDEVRVIKMGDFSTELCGGTHVKSTADIRLFKIVSEGGVSAGVRRIEALSGDAAVDYLLKAQSDNQKIRQSLGIKESWTQYYENKKSAEDAVEIVEGLRGQVKEAAKKLKQFQLEQIDYKELASKVTEANGHTYVYFQIDIEDRKVLGDIVERIRNQNQEAIIVVVGKADANYPILISQSKANAKSLPAGNILKSIAQLAGGKGGGRPELAQGAVDSIENMQDWITKSLA